MVSFKGYIDSELIILRNERGLKKNKDANTIKQVHRYPGILKRYFMAPEKCSLTSETLNRSCTPARLWLPRCDNPRKGTTSSSLSAGVVWEDRHDPPSSYQYSVFHIREKGILQSLFHGNSYPGINGQFLKTNGKQINID